MKKILVDEKGLTQFENKLNDYRQMLLSNACAGSQSFKEGVGDGWHDNFDFEQPMIKEKQIQNSINKMLLQRKLLKTVNPHSKGSDFVNIDDLIKIEMLFKNGGSEELIVKLKVCIYQKTMMIMK